VLACLRRLLTCPPACPAAVPFLPALPPSAPLQHNEAGRGCELSELVRYNGGLYTFDDRTGIMFEVLNPSDSNVRGAKAPAVAPRHIFMEGDGQTDKGQKIEWATVKDGLLYIGSFGKEYTDNAGNIANLNNLWTIVMNKEGSVLHANWADYYERVRSDMGYSFPG
jgi:soluble calcium-activated nucleotidase 1